MSDIINIKFNRKTFEIIEVTEGEGDDCKCHKPCDVDCNLPIDVTKHKPKESVKRISTMTLFDGSSFCIIFNGTVICF